jgi:hypothetical protein
MQFLLIAHDGSDADAPQRRQQARAAHLATAAEMLAGARVVARQRWMG